MSPVVPQTIFISLQEELEAISEELRIPGSKPLGPISRVGSSSPGSVVQVTDENLQSKLSTRSQI